jgi:flagellar basal body-associated protein FliL
LRPRRDSSSTPLGTPKGMLTILLIVLLVLVLFGGFGYSRRAR